MLVFLQWISVPGELDDILCWDSSLVSAIRCFSDQLLGQVPDDCWYWDEFLKRTVIYYIQSRKKSIEGIVLYIEMYSCQHLMVCSMCIWYAQRIFQCNFHIRVTILSSIIAQHQFMSSWMGRVKYPMNSEASQEAAPPPFLFVLAVHW